MAVALLRNTAVAQWFKCEERYIEKTRHTEILKKDKN